MSDDTDGQLRMMKLHVHQEKTQEVGRKLMCLLLLMMMMILMDMVQ